MKKILMILLCALMLMGCGEKNTSDENGRKTVEKEFDVDVDALEKDGYTQLSEIAYGKIEDGGSIPTVYLTYCQNSPELSFYVISAITQEFFQDLSPNFIIDWNGETYKYGDNMPDDVTEEEALDYFPSEWKMVIESVLKGGSVDSLVSKQSADIIDEDVEEFVNDYLENGTKEIISYEKYSIDGGDLTLSLSKQDEELKFEVNASAVTEDKAYLILSVFVAEFDGLSDEFYHSSITIEYGDLRAVYQQISDDNKSISGLNKDGTFTMEMPDWLDKDINNLNMPDEEIEECILELETNIKSFGKTCGYEMGVLLN